MLRRLNEHIGAQNAGVGGEDFGFRAVDRWLTVHAGSSASADLIARALPPPAGQPAARQWQDTPEDRALLGQLNRFCFRCHSSVAYHVFDKEAVFQRRDGWPVASSAGRSAPEACRRIGRWILA